MSLIMRAKTDAKTSFLRQPLHITYVALLVIFWVYTGLTTTNTINWALENSLTLSLLIILAAFYNIFRFSDLSYTLIFFYLILHIYGSQYQYEENPLGNWLQYTYNLTRNHYDRIVHFGFGLLLSYPMFEVFKHGFKVRRSFRYLLPIELTLSLSALYEIVEWIVADLVYESGEQGMAYLGAQGDVWDAQKDMGLAVLGSVIAMSITFLIRKQKRPVE
jgi:putative membrane protein